MSRADNAAIKHQRRSPAPDTLAPKPPDRKQGSWAVSSHFVFCGRRWDLVRRGFRSREIAERFASDLVRKHHWMPHPTNTAAPNWTNEQKAANALHDLMDALPAGTQTSMTAFRPEVNGQKAGTVKALLMAENADDLRCAQWVITQGAAKRGEGDE